MNKPNNGQISLVATAVRVVRLIREIDELASQITKLSGSKQLDMVLKVRNIARRRASIQRDIRTLENGRSAALRKTSALQL